MADLTDINPTLFGGDRVNFNLPDPAQRAQEDPPPAKTAPAHLALQGTPSDVRARATQEQLAVPTPSIADSITASAANFSVVAAWSALNGTQYADDPAFKWQEAMLQVPMSLSTPEQEFLQSGSAEEFQAKLDLVKRQRELGKDMAAHPAVASHWHTRPRVLASWRHRHWRACCGGWTCCLGCYFCSCGRWAWGY